MSKTIIIEISGGCLTGAFSPDVDTRIILFDWDNIKLAEAGDRKEAEARYEKQKALAPNEIIIEAP